MDTTVKSKVHKNVILGKKDCYQQVSRYWDTCAWHFTTPALLAIAMPAPTMPGMHAKVVLEVEL
jgi:hypothetical protein